MNAGNAEELGRVLMELLPEDGSSMGNAKLRRAIAERLGREIDESEYFAVQRALIDAGRLVAGRGRGGSVKRAASNHDALTLSAQEIPEAAKVPKPKQQGLAVLPQRKPGQPSGSKRKQDDEAKVLAYRHRDTRRNNPEVGMVTPDNDDEEGHTRWAFDAHIAPELRFDLQRADIENLIDDALASGDADAMREALATLKRMSAPYLNWTGKAERTSFEVDQVSLHVHERIDPATILTAVRKRMQKGASPGSSQEDMFRAWFEEPLPYREAIEFYKHDRGWANRLVAGDSLLVMNSLLQKEGMAGQVQMIYIDPPYGIKYGSNFQPFVNKRDVKDRKDEDLTQEPEMIKAFRDTWELGIHSYLTYLRDRLLLARELLHESGSVFLQISDENVHHTREILDEIFGAKNFVSLITVAKTSSATSELLAGVSDYVLWYASSREAVKYRELYQAKLVGGAGASQYTSLRYPNGSSKRAASPEAAIEDAPAGTRVFRLDNMTSQRPPGDFPVEIDGRKLKPVSGYWKSGESGIGKLGMAGRLQVIGNTLCYVRYINDFPVFPYSNLWTDTVSSGFADKKVYVVQTNASIVERCLLMTTDPGDLVIDPTCGSGTTAFVAEKWGRRWITCDTSRVAVTLAKQRLLTASYDYYHLKYPHEGLKAGFNYRTVPHVTLKSIANNPEIDEIWEKMHPSILTALDELNTALRRDPPPPFRVTEGGRKDFHIDFSTAAKASTTLPSGEEAPTGALLEWEVPFEFPDDWPAASRTAFDDFHTARQTMQRRMDQSIAAHADQETLFDQPEVDKDKLRITGPFTVEAVPFPSVMALEEAHQVREADDSIARSGESARQHAWRDELLKSHVRGKGGQMLKFAELETLPDTDFLHCSGSLSESGDRVVVSFGPEHAALEQRQVELAMREAGDLFPRPKMIVFCAFTFDPEAAKDIDATKGIVALKVQMNTDLLTEDLKKGRASNQSFWLMGQPDVELRQRKDGQYEVEVNGFDYFDTAKSELVSGGKKNIAAWMLDTDYDERSLFPAQVFFPMAGAKDGWNKLKRNIRAELDDAKLDRLHSTVSLPFEAGDNRRVAVKIVDDRGIESLKVIGLDRKEA